MKINPDSLAARMKEYEYAYRIFLPRRSYVVIRIDGRAFHTYTKGCEKPYDWHLAYALREVAWDLLQEIDNAIFGYVQSDEISILLWDDKDIKSEAWFANNLQKLCSVSASIATARLNACYKHPRSLQATFDSRVWVLPTQAEVFNYFYWRWQDCERNSVQSFGQAHLSHAELQGKNKSEVIQMVWDKHQMDWHKQAEAFKNGMFVSVASQEDPRPATLETTKDKYISECFNVREDKKRLLDMIPLPTILTFEESTDG